MSDVIIAGIGQTPVGEHWELSLRSLAARAILAALKDAPGLQPQAIYIGNFLASVLSHQSNLGALIADNTGLRGVEAFTVEAAGASGAGALRLAYMAVASGYIDTAVAVGVEKYTDVTGAKQESAAALSADYDYEGVQGITAAAQAGLVMQRYLHEYGVPRDCLGGFALAGHAQAVNNPNAMFRKAITSEAYAKAGMVSAPLNLFDVAPYADGAAAVVVTRSDRLPAGFAHPAVRISGSGSAIDTLALHDRHDLLAFQAARVSAERACRKAGILPRDVDLLELGDSFGIYGILSLEAAGFAARGQGWKLALDSAALDSAGGKGLRISTMGGMKGRGNPLGAAGMYQVVEAVQQLRGQAGANQVPGARRALVQALGGPASTAITHVLERVNR
jgi:acetyl-CoA C-acetyltransferase